MRATERKEAEAGSMEGVMAGSRSERRRRGRRSGVGSSVALELEPAVLAEPRGGGMLHQRVKRGSGVHDWRVVVSGNMKLIEEEDE
ncbi:hypothetical protein LINPERHAP1_LOCUS36408 [Linum perenne]